jgi:AraC family transcriptional regulator, regulatory protein of adaptative response / methylated-DNA-[protein]-cysteine methyltransferase
VVRARRARYDAHMTDLSEWRRAAHAIALLDARDSAPSIVAQALGMDDEAFRRFFTRWAGISPTRFRQVRAADRARRLLRAGRDVLSAAHESGLSGPGRLHDVIVHVDAVTPGAHRTRGVGVTIRTGVHDTAYGTAFIAVTERGICHLTFVDDDTALRDRRAALLDRWPAAEIRDDPSVTAPAIAAAFDPLRSARAPLAVHLKGTNFQVAVWRALLRIPVGAAVSYRDIATAVGRPTATRAVGTAVGDNPVSYLIPCHRVLRSDGGIGGYAWGIARKQAMLLREGRP